MLYLHEKKPSDIENGTYLYGHEAKILYVVIKTYFLPMYDYNLQFVNILVLELPFYVCN